MTKIHLKFAFFLLILTISYGCGIKKEPVPIPKPSYEIKRIGEKVYLIPDKDVVKAEGFVKKGKYFIRIDSKAFCFRVYHRLGRSQRSCVDEAFRDLPRIVREISEDELALKLFGFDHYRIYRVSEEGQLIPDSFMEIKKQTTFLNRRFSDYVVAVTGVRGSVESDPVFIKVPSKEPPTPVPPQEVKTVLKGQKIVLYWTHTDEDVVFEVYRNGVLLTPRPIRVTVFSERAPDKPAVYEIVAVNRFGKKSLPARIFYRP